MARGATYNFIRLFMWRVNSDGIAVGQLDPDSLGSPPVTSHALDVRGPITATLPEATFSRFEFRGGGTYDGSVTGGVESLGAGEISLDQIDPALISLARGGLEDATTIAGSHATIYAENLLNTSPFEVGLMLVGQKQQFGSVKRNLFWHTIYPRVTCTFVKPNPTQEAGVNSQTPLLRFDPQVATKFPWGAAFGANQNWYNFSEVSFMIDSQYPYALTSWVADGTATTFTSAFKPQYSTVTSGNTDNVTAKGGVPTALTSIAPTTGVHTVAAAGSSGDLWVSFYPTQRYTPV